MSRSGRLALTQRHYRHNRKPGSADRRALKIAPENLANIIASQESL
jgi:hypothetical protein